MRLGEFAYEDGGSAKRQRQQKQNRDGAFDPTEYEQRQRKAQHDMCSCADRSTTANTVMYEAAAETECYSVVGGDRRDCEAECKTWR